MTGGVGGVGVSVRVGEGTGDGDVGEGVGEGSGDGEVGEGLGLFDGVDAGEVEHDASLVTADGEPVADDLDGAGVGRGACEVGRCEVDLVAVVETGREVSEKFGEDFALPSLRTEQVGKDGPRGRRVRGVRSTHLDSIVLSLATGLVFKVM